VVGKFADECDELSLNKAIIEQSRAFARVICQYSAAMSPETMDSCE
jgi:hypothetical protein